MVVSLHKIDRWDTVLTLRTFDQFAIITLGKPSTTHKTRGSFYLIAKNVQPDHEAAVASINNWTKSWKDATTRSLVGENGEGGTAPGYGKEDVISAQ